MERARSRRVAELRELLKTLGLSVAIALCMRVAVAQAYVVEGHSMEPTLHDGERLLVARMAYGLSIPGRREAVATWALPYPGDIVVIESPAEPVDLVKRVVGLPGDVLEWRGDVLLRNGEALAHAGPEPCPEHPRATCVSESDGRTSYSVQRSGGFPSWPAGAVRVPPGHVYVVGDHRDRSNDSRAFGPVPARLLRGRVLF